MQIIKLDNLRPAIGRAAKFEGAVNNANNSFFVVNSQPGRGVDKHRHPYEEIFIVLSDNIEAVIDNKLKILNKNEAVVIPPNTWHEFTNKADNNALMVTIHNSSKVIQEYWGKN
jgi:quercetin dioxygenase-like cupin family protein